MKTLAVYALIALNLALGTALLARFGKEQTAVAQVGRPSDYQMIPGNIVGTTDACIYILDQSNGYLGAMVFNGATGRFDILQPIELARLMEDGGGVAPRSNNVRPPR